MIPFRTKHAETPTRQTLSDALYEGFRECILPAEYNLDVKFSALLGYLS